MISKKAVEKVLDSIPDPEIGVSVWDLGLVYKIDISQKSGQVAITMTLTSLGCPLFEQIAGPIREQVSQIPGVKSVDVELTFDPPWNIELMSQKARERLGI